MGRACQHSKTWLHESPEEGEVSHGPRGETSWGGGCTCHQYRQDAPKNTWTWNEQATDCKILWSEVWNAEPLWTKFLVQSLHLVFPSLSIFSHWDLIGKPVCPLGQSGRSQEHISSFSLKALGKGLSHWHHDQVPGNSRHHLHRDCQQRTTTPNEEDSWLCQERAEVTVILKIIK